MTKNEIKSIFNALTAIMLIFGWAFLVCLGDFVNLQTFESLTGLISVVIVLMICLRMMFALANYKPKKKGGGKKGCR